MDKKINLANMLLKKHIDHADDKGEIRYWRTTDNDVCVAAELGDSWLVVMTNHDILQTKGIIGSVFKLADDFIEIIEEGKKKIIDFSDMDMFDSDTQ